MFQITVVVALWCAAGIARENLTRGIGYAAITSTVTWIVVGRCAVTLPHAVCCRILAATTTAMVAGAFGVTALIGEADHLPIVCLFTGILAFIPWSFGTLTGIGGNLLLIGLVYFVCQTVVHIWDSMNRYSYTAASTQGPLASAFTILITILSLPVLIVILTGGCFELTGHGTAKEGMFHLPFHCAVHLGMLLLSVLVLVLLNRVCRRTSYPAPDWLKLITLGFLHLYAVLVQVALFPYVFRLTFV